jgi:hypothetical protein
MFLCYVMVSRLVQTNYRDVGGHGLSCGEMTDELSHYLFSLENTEFLNYDAVNMLVKASMPNLDQHLCSIT